MFEGGVKAPKDFGAGVIYIVVGFFALILAKDYGFGSLARMGAGFFPIVLSILLMIFGAASVVRSFLKPGEPIGGFGWKGFILVLGGTIAFGLLIRPAGLIISLVLLILVSAAASRNFKIELRSSLGLVALVGLCALVFVKLLGVPMPLLGYWFG